MSYRLKKKKNVHLIISYPCFFIEKKKKKYEIQYVKREK